MDYGKENALFSQFRLLCVLCHPDLLGNTICATSFDALPFLFYYFRHFRSEVGSNNIPVDAVCDTLPVLGTGTVLIPWTLIAVLLGAYSMAVGVALLYLVITAIRNTVEPKQVGTQIGLQPPLTLVSMVVGANLFGILGLFGFPVALSIYAHLRSDKSRPEKIRINTRLGH